jgi:hypothetical protein
MCQGDVSRFLLALKNFHKGLRSCSSNSTVSITALVRQILLPALLFRFLPPQKGPAMPSLLAVPETLATQSGIADGVLHKLPLMNCANKNGRPVGTRTPDLYRINTLSGNKVDEDK